MIAKIIPLTKLPRKFDFFDYKIPEDLETKIQIGHIVVVSFHRQTIRGIVVEILSESDQSQALLPIVNLTNIIIPNSFLKLIGWFSNYYLSSPSLFCKMFIPSAPQRRSLSGDIKYPQNLSLLKNEADNAIEILRAFKKNTDFFIYENSFKEILAVFIKLIAKELAEQKQILFLVPSPADLKIVLPYLQEYFPQQLIVWKSKLSKNESFAQWMKILQKKSCLVLGTRTAVFLPFTNLSLSLVYNASSVDYKQWDMNPRYDSRSVLEKITEAHRAQIIFSDIMPDINIYSKIKSGKIISINSSAERPQFTLFDLRQEKNNSFSNFSYPLHEIIADSLSRNKKTIIFFNRQEKDSVLICKDCSFIFRCPACQRPYNIDKNNIFCYHCRRKEDVPLSCAKCGSNRLGAIKIGLDSFKKILAKDFPSLKMAMITKEREEIPQDFDVLITTDVFWRTALSKLSWDNLYGAVAADFDAYFLRPDFNQKETALLFLERFLRFGKNNSAEKILVQTLNPDNHIFTGRDVYMDEELRERRENNYPPFGKLIKIICKEENFNKLQKEAEALHASLIKLGYSAAQPFEPHTKKRTKNYLMHIIIKSEDSIDANNLKKIIPGHYQIDVNPISLI